MFPQPSVVRFKQKMHNLRRADHHVPMAWIKVERSYSIERLPIFVIETNSGARWTLLKIAVYEDANHRVSGLAPLPAMPDRILRRVPAPFSGSQSLLYPFAYRICQLRCISEHDGLNGLIGFQALRNE